MSEEQTVTYELEGEIALVGLNRPDKRNCFNPTVMKQLREAIERAGEEAKCGIIWGHGDNFCAGLDLRWAAESWKTGRSERLPFQFNRNSYFEVMARGNIPFIAALHGATEQGVEDPELYRVPAPMRTLLAQCDLQIPLATTRERDSVSSAGPN